MQGDITDAIATKNPIPCALGDDDYIYGFTCNRITPGTGVPALLDAYLLVGHLSDALNIGGAAFRIYKIGEVEVTAIIGNNLNSSPESGNTGLPTAVKHGSWIYFFYQEEEWAGIGGDDTKTPRSNIKYLAVNTRNTRLRALPPAPPPAVKKLFPLSKRGAMR